MNQDVVLALTVPGMFGWFAWLIFNTIRRYKIAKLQAEVQTKLLEKVDSGQELLAYAQTETGRELLESLKVERIAPQRTNHRRAANRNYSSLCRRSSSAAAQSGVCR